MENQTVTRIQLYDLVWSVPFTTLAKTYAISDVGLRKICVKMEIPLPKSGHWEKVRFNKPVTKIELSNTYVGANEVTLSMRTGDSNITNEVKSPIIKLEHEIINQETENLIVHSKLINPDQLIITAKEHLTQKRKYGTKGNLANTNSNGISITVADHNVNRALRFMDTFIKIMRKRGHQIVIRNHCTYIVIQTAEIAINFREKLKRMPTSTPYGDPHYGYLATNILTFNAKIDWNNVQWQDGKILPEKQLPKIIAKLELTGEALKNRAIEREINREEREKKRRIEEEKQKHKENELLSFKKMLQNSKQWQEAKILRNYLDDIEIKAKANCSLSDELKIWLQWGREKADWYDPQTTSPDDLLNEVDQENLDSIKKSNFYH